MATFGQSAAALLLAALATTSLPLARASGSGGLVERLDALCDALAADPPRRVELRAKDFEEGTYRITEPGLYVLAEDVAFNPNRGDVAGSPNAFDPARNGDWSPTPAQRATGGQYAGTGYVLGFFAAVAVEVSDVVLDLGGHTLEAHPEFALQQRFFSLVELASAPFIAGAGPADFGGDFAAASRACVQNGTLGLTSHHGVHGNDNDDVLVRDVAFRSFEVAAVHLNRARRAAVARVTARGSRVDVPVLGAWSAARFLRPFAAAALAAAGDEHPAKARALAGARDRLVTQMDAFFRGALSGGDFPAGLDPASERAWRNVDGLEDGNNYGVVIHSRGPAVNDFADRVVGELTAPPLEGRKRDAASSEVAVVDSEVSGIVAKVREVVALTDPEGKPFLDPSGAVFQVELCADRSTGEYSPGPLCDAQVALADLCLALELGPRCGRLSIPRALVDWARPGGGALGPLVEAHGWRYARNGDSMFHVNKGPVGLRIDGTSDFLVRGLTLRGVSNEGPPGQALPLPGEGGEKVAYTGPSDGGHPLQAAGTGYQGADARGISIASTAAGRLEDVAVSGVWSAWGSAVGVDLINDNKSLVLENISVGGVTAAARAPGGAPGWPAPVAPVAAGFRVSPESQPLSSAGVAVSDVQVASAT